MKFHNTNLKSQIREKMFNVRDTFTIVTTLVLLFIVCVISIPVQAISVGVIKKITAPFLDLQSRIGNYLFSKLIFTIYTM